MTLPDGLEWAAPGLHSDEWCVRWSGAAVMLCGRVLDAGNRQNGFVPLIQPVAVPANAHQPCVAALEGRHGCCPVCGGDIATDGGVLVSHGVWRVGRDGVAASDEPCPGAGQAPEAGR